MRSHCSSTNSHRGFTTRTCIRTDGYRLLLFRTTSTKSNCLTTRCISGITNCNCTLGIRLTNNRFFRNFSATNRNRASASRFSVNPCCQGFAASCTVIIIVIVSICAVYMVEMNAICTSGCNLPLQTLSNMEQLATIDGISARSVNFTRCNMFNLPFIARSTNRHLVACFIQ